MTLIEAAAYLGLSVEATRRFAADGELVGERRITRLADGLPNRHWRFEQSDLDDFIERHRVEPGSLGVLDREARYAANRVVCDS